MRLDRGPRHAAPSGRSWRQPATSVGLVLLLVGGLSLSAKALDPAAPAAPTFPRTLLGAGAWDGSGTAAQQAATRRLEAAIGRPLAIAHSFVPWGKGLGRQPAANVAAGRTPLISFGKGGNPSEVAAGEHDPYLKSLARSVAELGGPVLLRYAWGMDGARSRRSSTSGTTFVAAWRHVHDLFAAQGVRAFWVWSPNAEAFAGVRGGVDRYWPGDDYVDWIGANGFNWYGCKDRTGWKDFGSIFQAFHDWGSARAKPLIVSETGTVEDPARPGRKRDWFLDAARVLGQSMPRIRAVVYSDRGGRCDLRPDTSAPSMEGFVRFARDPFFGPVSGTPAPLLSTTTAPPTTAAPTTSTTSPTSTTSTQSIVTVPPAPTPSSCGGGGVSIGTGDDAQSVVNAHAAGSTYIVKAGTHYRNFSVRPKSGDTFCGEPDAILDGGRSLQFAFYGGGTNVTLDSITVQNYNTGRQNAAIHPDQNATGWVVRNVSALRNYWAGLQAADGMKILGGHYNDNDQLGIAGGTTTEVTLDGLDSDPATFDGPEMARNRTVHASCDFEAGGMKWVIGRVTIRNAHVHDNACRGLWGDINANGALIENNLVEDNWAEGIFYEISQNAIIRNNRVYRNGNGHRSGWYWDGGITVASSSGVEVYGNRLSGNYNGITGTQQDRTDSTPPTHLLDDYHVHDNLICAVGAGGEPTGVEADNGANLASRDITFNNNTTRSTPC
jgi:parallel beta-helix repeat protein